MEEEFNNNYLNTTYQDLKEEYQQYRNKLIKTLTIHGEQYSPLKREERSSSTSSTEKNVKIIAQKII